MTPIEVTGAYVVGEDKARDKIVRNRLRRMDELFMGYSRSAISAVQFKEQQQERAGIRTLHGWINDTNELLEPQVPPRLALLMAYFSNNPAYIPYLQDNPERWFTYNQTEFRADCTLVLVSVLSLLNFCQSRGDVVSCTSGWPIVNTTHGYGPTFPGRNQKLFKSQFFGSHGDSTAVMTDDIRLNEGCEARLVRIKSLSETVSIVS